jgi:hypothetical protein
MHLAAELRIMQQDLLSRYSLLVRKRPGYLPSTVNLTSSTGRSLGRELVGVFQGSTSK